MQRTTKKDGGGERKKPAPPWPDGPKSADPVPDPLGDDDWEGVRPDTKPIPY